MLFIKSINAFQEHSSKVVGEFLDRYPNLKSIFIIANYIFRTMIMVTFMRAFPYAPLVCFGIGCGYSLFYSMTAERTCKPRYALAACMGAGVYDLWIPAMNEVIKKVAYCTLAYLGLQIVKIIPALFCVALVLHDANKPCVHCVERT